MLQRVIEVPLIRLDDLYRQHCAGVPDFVSLDTEGLEMDILTSADFKKFRPLMFCIETLSYSARGQGLKDAEIIRHMEAQGYLAYADTNTNTIFVDEQRWRNR